MKKVWSLIVLAASLASGSEMTPFVVVDTDHFTAKVPNGWQVKLSTQDTNRWTYAFQDGTNVVFRADVWRGSGFIECFCAPWNEYRVIKRIHEEVRTIRIGHVRTLKIAGESYSLDIHASPEFYDDGLIDRILVSISMKWKSATQAPQAIGSPASQPSR